MLAGEALALTLWRQLLSIHRQEVEVRREGTKKVQNIVSAIISNDALTLDGGAQLHCLIFLVQHAVPLDLQFIQYMERLLAAETKDQNTQHV